MIRDWQNPIPWLEAFIRRLEVSGIAIKTQSLLPYIERGLCPFSPLWLSPCVNLSRHQRCRSLPQPLITSL
jgi:hypothetical protein